MHKIAATQDEPDRISLSVCHKESLDLQRSYVVHFPPSGPLAATSTATIPFSEVPQVVRHKEPKKRPTQGGDLKWMAQLDHFHHVFC